MTDQLAKLEEILSAGRFQGHRIRLIGATNTVAVELRGLSDADMDELGGKHVKVAVEPRSSIESGEKQPVSELEQGSKAKQRFGFLDRGDAE